MAEPAIKTATYEDLQAVPANMVAEIIGGRLVTHPRPAPRHARASSLLGAELTIPFDAGRGGPGGWVNIDEPELHLGDHVLVPDLAGWRRENMPELPQTAWFETPPDWICEVLSPSTARYDRLEKRDIYAKFGVSHLWFIDPDTKTLEAFELRERQWLLVATRANDDEVAIAPFAEVPFSLGALWG
jgi:Uma2 family endonuclease